MPSIARCCTTDLGRDAARERIDISVNGLNRLSQSMASTLPDFDGFCGERQHAEEGYELMPTIIYAGKGLQRNRRSLRVLLEYIQMRFRSLQILACEPLFEAVVDRGKQRAGLLALTLLLPKAGEAGSAAQLPR